MRRINVGKRGPLTGQTLRWLVAREARLIERREWADQTTVDGVKRALKFVRYDIEVLSSGAAG